MDVWRTLNRKMIKFFQNKHVGRIVVSVGYPLLAFWSYWRAFDGNYTRTDVFWGATVTIALAIAIHLYFPIAKKVERGSITWFLGLLTMICLFALGSVLMGLWTHWIIMIPVAEEAWGEYISYFAIWMPFIHVIAKKQGKGQDMPHEIIPHGILLFKGPAAWNKAKGYVGRGS
ncbi:MAG: hypothetical protein OXH34_09535 [Bacteroidetes bacterium]|nr:hypothetical protein [Bacteroidota bacterium]